jgi:hypothetical protein
MQWDAPIKSQASCGSCWAFAAVSAVENQYHKLKGSLTLFSEQYLVNCDNYDGACDGGWPSNTFTWIKENGLVASEALPYVAFKEVCDETLKQYQYKIVNGYSEYNPTMKYEELLAKGPLVVAMDASFEGFSSYRPVNFDPIVPNLCGNINHAVTVVSTVTENGQKYIIARNSWGTNFGYKGYLKMPFDKSCGMTQYAWLPFVYDGHVPDGKPEPKPAPIVSNCVTLSGYGGFTDKIMETCDSVPQLPTPYTDFNGIKFPEGNEGKDLFVWLFLAPQCSSSTRYRINSSYENFQIYNIKPQSLAYEKAVSKARCVDLFLQTCFAGNPELTVCGDVTDTQLYNYTRLREIKSLIANPVDVKRIIFYTAPNFSGSSYSVYFYTGKPLFRLTKYVTDFISLNVIRSIKIEYTN